MFSRLLLARSSPARLSAALTTRVYSRSLTTLRLARCTVLQKSSASLRRLSIAPAIATEDQDDTQRSITPSGTCYIANIPFNVTAEELKEAFSEFGKVMSVRLLTSNSGLSRGVGFVRFESVTDAVNFIETHTVDPIYVLDRQLFVQHAQKTRDTPGHPEPCDTLMVRNFQGESVAGVRTMFGSYADQISAVRFDKKEDGQPSRRAFVQFRDVNTATEAMEAFKTQNENGRILYARQRQTPANTHALTSRLSQHQGQ